MKKLLHVAKVTIVGLSVLPLIALAQDGRTSGEIEITAQGVTGDRENAKFDEYKETPDGSTGGVILNYEDKGGYFFSLDAERISLDDQRTVVTGGQYGEFTLEGFYDQIPHRFALGARSIYAGVGTDTMTLSPGLQTELQNSSSTANLASRLQANFAGSAQEFDIELMRKKGGGTLVYKALDPITVTVSGSREQRSGTQPFFGAFGFGNAIELVNPIAYDTDEARVVVEYATQPLYLSAAYYVSVFTNNADTLTFDNPFRLTDNTGASAYTTPSMFTPPALPGATTTPAPIFLSQGARQGLIDLAPDNTFHNLALNGALGELPMRGRLTANASFGWWDQNDDLVPWTTNTAIIPGAANEPPFDTSDIANVTRESAEASAFTQMYHLKYAAQPTDMVDLTLKYRFYDYDNQTDHFEGPGHVRFDAVWEPEGGVNEPPSWQKQQAAADVGVDVTEATRLGLGYAWEGIERDKREVDSSDDNVVQATLDHKVNSMVDVRTRYEKLWRDVDEYDFTVPFEELIHEGSNPPQVPFLRKYDEASQERDRLHFLTTVSPTEELAVSLGYIYSQSEYDESDMGLLSDRGNVISGDIDYAMNDLLTVTAFYSWENHRSRQKERQWNPGGVGDPFVKELGVEANSNWDEVEKDVVHTVGAGGTVALIADRLFGDLTYTYSDASGEIDFYSPVGVGAAPAGTVGAPPPNDNNAFVPASWDTVDQTIVQRINPRVRAKLQKNLELVVGYLWEIYQASDFNDFGFSNVPTNATGAYNAGLLMGTLPLKDYNVGVVYTTLKYRF